jgi:hypothetical protein
MNWNYAAHSQADSRIRVSDRFIMPASSASRAREGTARGADPASFPVQVYSFTTHNECPIRDVSFRRTIMAAALAGARVIVEGPVAAPAIGGSAICFFDLLAGGAPLR